LNRGFGIALALIGTVRFTIAYSVTGPVGMVHRTLPKVARRAIMVGVSRGVALGLTAVHQRNDAARGQHDLVCGQNRNRNRSLKRRDYGHDAKCRMVGLSFAAAPDGNLRRLPDVGGFDDAGGQYLPPLLDFWFK
jgi:hypothetical protein